jgi:hypothetical protein
MKLKDYCLSSGVDLFSSFKALIMYNDSKIILLDYKKDLPTNGVKNLVCIDNQYENIIWIADLPTKLYDISMLAQASRLCSVLASTMPFKSTTYWQAMIIKLSLLFLEVSS